MRYGTSVARRVKTSALILAAATVSLLPAAAARAQVVYDSISGGFTTAGSELPFRPNTGASSATDDFGTTLFDPQQPQQTFFLSTLEFVGGPEFTGPSTRENSTLVFRFLRLDGAPVFEDTRREVQFDTSGNFLRTIEYNAFVPTQGFLSISTLANSGATASFAFGSTPTVGSNSPTNGDPQTIRAFRLTASVVPEPGTIALLGAGAIPFIGRVIRRRKS